MEAEKYRKMQMRLQLPQLNELRDTFKFEIEDNEKIFDSIRSEISERLFMFTEKVIEPLIGEPDSFSAMLEQNMLDNASKKRLFDVYRKIQVLKWENNILMIKPDDARTAQWIRKTWQLWNEEIEKNLTGVCAQLSSGWQDLEFKKETTSYHG